MNDKYEERVDGERRQVLKGTALAAALGITGIIELLYSPAALADYPEAGFKGETVDDVLKAMFDGAAPAESGDITIKAPDIAENGAVVPVSVKTNVPGVKSISIIVEKNPAPLAASFEMGEGAVADVSTRIKMGETSNVVALVETEGGLLSAQKEVKVTIGGCGG